MEFMQSLNGDFTNSVAALLGRQVLRSMEGRSHGHCSNLKLCKSLSASARDGCIVSCFGNGLYILFCRSNWGLVFSVLPWRNYCVGTEGVIENLVVFGINLLVHLQDVAGSRLSGCDIQPFNVF